MADSKGELGTPGLDGWRKGTNDGAPCVYAPNGAGFVAFNEDMSGLYVADVREVPFCVVEYMMNILRHGELDG